MSAGSNEGNPQENQLRDMLQAGSMKGRQLPAGQNNKSVSNPMAEMRYGLQPKAEGQNEFQSQLMSRFGR